jgi:outer membrane immunogenic protein
MLNPFCAARVARAVPTIALLLLPNNLSAAPNDAYRSSATQPVCACSGVTTTSSGYGTPYSPPASYRPLDNSPRYAASSTGPAPAYSPPLRRDLGRPAYAAPYDAPALWTGFYAGAHAGYAWGKTSVGAPGYGSTNPTGALGGIHGGHNWQTGSYVFGIESDLDLSWMDSSTTYASGNKLTSHPGWTSSIRGRAGYAFNNFLVYGTAGLALTNTNVTLQQPGSTTQMLETQFGYVIGAGVDMKLAPQLSARIEALHYGFADKNVSYGGTTTPLSNDMTTVRAGLTFHFN